MRVFVTGASGWIASAVIPELVNAGHQVVGLARSDRAAAKVARLGAEVLRGELADTDVLREAAAASEGVVHLGFIHDFAAMEEAAQTDLAAIRAIGAGLEGTGRPLLIASGLAGLAPGRLATEEDTPDPASHPRIFNAEVARGLADVGVRSLIARFAPTVHGPGDPGFMATLVAIAREKGASGYIDDGGGRWPAVHVADAGALVRLALESAPAGTVLHAVAEEGIPTRAIAEAIGRGLDLPVVALPREEAAAHFGWMAQFFGLDVAATATATRQLLGWEPTHPGLLDDLDAGYYFKE